MIFRKQVSRIGEEKAVTAIWNIVPECELQSLATLVMMQSFTKKKK